MQDCTYMQMALELAEKGCGWTAPNPMVGAVIVKDGEIIGKGWHRKCGEYHAERNALADCRKSPKGATMYVTLEPCCHEGRQPPCTDAIIDAGISRVVVGCSDPNPCVGGKGIERLRAKGIEVTENVLREECERLNQVFFHYIRTGRPFVVMKYAMTMDGKIAARTGVSKWVTAEPARNHVQKLRHRYTAIMVGIGTVLTDDPLLTCRLPEGKNPVRIICDTHLHTPVAAQVVTTAEQAETIIATSCSDRQKYLPYEKMGCRVMYIPEKDGHLDLNLLMDKLGQMEIDSILLEGGGTLNWAALNSGIVQKTQVYIAPKLFGGKEAKTPVEGRGVDFPKDAFRLENSRISQIGEDFLIESEVAGHVYRNC